MWMWIKINRKPAGVSFNITTRSATGWPASIVPFLNEPTGRTSSTAMFNPVGAKMRLSNTDSI